MTRQRSQSGFTLLEVVIAFVVLALVLTSVFQVFSTGLARTANLDEYSRALVIAQSRLAAANIEEGVKEGQAKGESLQVEKLDSWTYSQWATFRSTVRDPSCRTDKKSL